MLLGRVGARTKRELNLQEWTFKKAPNTPECIPRHRRRYENLENTAFLEKIYI